MGLSVASVGRLSAVLGRGIRYINRSSILPIERRCSSVINLTSHIITDATWWNDALCELPMAHILQTWEWGEFKHRTTGWQPTRIAFKQGQEVVAMVSVGTRRIAPFTLMYAPKAPAMPTHDPALIESVLMALEQMARRWGNIWFKIDPDVVWATGLPDSEEERFTLEGQTFTELLQARRWKFSNDQPQFRNTVTLDLRASEDELLANMSQTTRRKVRTAEKKDVSVRLGGLTDLPILYELYRTTSERDGFLIRPLEYYRQAWEHFMERGLAQPLIAEYEGVPIAHVILYHFGKTCWYFYGASSNEERNRMPNYLLQWESMRWAKAQGYTTYDMWGAPNQFDETDSMWGVYEFKRGFKGEVRRHIGAWDYAPNLATYWAYTQAVPSLLRTLRRVRR